MLIDIKKLYGNKYRIEFDPSYEKGLNKIEFYIIPCKYGYIYAYSEEYLVFYCTGKKIKNKLHSDHSEIEMRNESDNGEAMFIFKEELFNIIAEYARPKRKKVLSENNKIRFIQAGREALKKYRNNNDKSRKSGQGKEIMNQAG